MPLDVPSTSLAVRVPLPPSESFASTLIVCVAPNAPDEASADAVGTPTTVGVYVDDTVHVYSDGAEFEELNSMLKRDFLGYTDLGPLTEIFNAEVTETDTHILISQKRFIEDLTKRFLNGESVKVHTPAESEGPDELGKLVREAVESLIVMLSPFAPHTMEELWQMYGHAGKIGRAHV